MASRTNYDADGAEIVDADRITSAVVAAFIERNPDLYREALADCLMHGTITAETIEKIAWRMDSETCLIGGDEELPDG